MKWVCMDCWLIVLLSLMFVWGFGFWFDFRFCFAVCCWVVCILWFFVIRLLWLAVCFVVLRCGALFFIACWVVLICLWLVCACAGGLVCGYCLCLTWFNVGRLLRCFVLLALLFLVWVACLWTLLD